MLVITMFQTEDNAYLISSCCEQTLKINHWVTDLLIDNTDT